MYGQMIRNETHAHDTHTHDTHDTHDTYTSNMLQHQAAADVSKIGSLQDTCDAMMRSCQNDPLMHRKAVGTLSVTA